MKLINSSLPFGSDTEWQMNSCERLALVALLDYLRPRNSIEIGTQYGGSLAVLSRYSERVLSFDLNPAVPERLKHFTNVEFVTGNSGETVPPVLSRLQEAEEPVEFVLIDGDHTARGVRQDCHSFLSARPVTTQYILMHDSFNPDVRQGIKTAGWEQCPYVKALDLDFVPGIMLSDDKLRRQMWGGFALAILGPEERTGDLEKSASSEMAFRALYPFSAHHIVSRTSRKIGAVRRQLMKRA